MPTRSQLQHRGIRVCIEPIVYLGNARRFIAVKIALEYENCAKMFVETGAIQMIAKNFPSKSNVENCQKDF
jgi:hypothetical protein